MLVQTSSTSDPTTSSSSSNTRVFFIVIIRCWQPLAALHLLALLLPTVGQCFVVDVLLAYAHLVFVCLYYCCAPSICLVRMCALLSLLVASCCLCWLKFSVQLSLPVGCCAPWLSMMRKFPHLLRVASNSSFPFCKAFKFPVYQVSSGRA